jgi:ectoine hydroxylase-related dioxygenase (phytanoyl-CoA dioxygenase family)
MTGRVAELFGEPAVLFKEKINFKLPGGGGFTPHQDIQPGWDEYAPYFISVLITVDDSTLANGCLELAAGHHTRGMIGRKWKPLEGHELDGITFVPYPMQPGDAAFFDCFVPHQSKPNFTDTRRRNLYLTYNRLRDGDRRQKYFDDKRKSYPPDNEREPGKEYVFRV